MDMLFENNVSNFSGGGLVMNLDESLFIGGNTIFRDNISMVRGGAISIKGPDPFGETDPDFYIRDTVFRDNQADQGGGAIWWRSDDPPISPLELRRVEFISNTTGGSGGAIYNDEVLHIFDSEFLDNIAAGNDGAIFSDDEGVEVLARNTFSGNIP